MKLCIVTPSFHRDHELCVDLCRSVDRHAGDAFEHVIVVPNRDMALFRPLHRGRRRVIAKEDVLPNSIMTVPFPAVVTLPFVGTKRVRTLWVTPRLRLVRGWILQQVVKFSADKLSDADGFVFMDSDLALVRPVDAQTFVRGETLMMHYEPNCIEHSLDLYQAWQDTACDLLGVPRYPFAGDSYISAILPWRRDRLVECQARIEATTGLDYRTALLRQSRLSEYVVYGVFCHKVVGRNAGHFEESRPLVLEDWLYDTTTREGIDAFIAGLKPHHLAVLIQSTNEWPMEARRRVIDAVEARA